MISYILNTSTDSGIVSINDNRIIIETCEEFQWMKGQNLDSIMDFLKKDNNFKGIEKIKGGDNN